MQLIVELWTGTPVSFVPLSSSFRVTFGFFLAWSVSFGGQASPRRFVVVPYSFHFVMMDLDFKIFFFITQPWFNLLHSFVSNLFEELLGLHDVVYLVVPLHWYCWRICGLSKWVYIYWVHVTLGLHTHGPYSSNYVTSKGKYIKSWTHV